MASVPFVYVNGTLSLLVKGKMVSVNPEHPSYVSIKKVLATATEDEIAKLLDVEKVVKNYVENESDGKAIVKDGKVYYNGELVHNTIANRIISFMKEGLPFKHLLRFLENINQNPSYTSRQELYDFLENKGLPITDDGQFLAYKSIREDWLDKYSGKIANKIGDVVEVERGSVDDNRANECSHGLHCGALDYVYSYGNGTDRIVIVKVNPRDAVSVPKDHAFQKLRCCRYEVVREFEGKLLDRPLYTQQANPVPSEVDDEEYDWDWCDDYDDEGGSGSVFNDRDDGDYVDEDDEAEFDEDGYDEYGYDEDGYDRDGYNYYGYDRDGYDDEGLNEDGEYRPDELDSNNVGLKPNGQRYHNVRDNKGKFAPKK